MKAVIAIDSLKGSLSSMEAGYAIADGIRRVHGQDAECSKDLWQTEERELSRHW